MITSKQMTETVEKTVERTWFERLFSWPWRPWVRTKTIMKEIPSDEFLVLNERAIMCHPEMEKEIKSIFENMESEG